MHGLTGAQRRCFDEIRAFISEHGFPPTHRELSVKLGGMSTNAVSNFLIALEKKAYIARPGARAGPHRGVARNIVLLREKPALTLDWPLVLDTVAKEKLKLVWKVAPSPLRLKY